jgi:hypothetical protein
MRLAIQCAAGLIAAALVSSVAATAAETTTAPAAKPGVETARSNGPAWCGFEHKAGSHVRCGFSSETECKQMIGGKDAICIIDPYRT